MTTNNQYKPNRGSEWRKWDLHVHTPESGMANGFNGDWDTYVKTLFTAAVKNNVAALGITDYFTIDGYKELKTEYCNNESKLLKLFDNDTIFVQKVKNIAIFPNIEFRLRTLVGSNRINYHIIFSDEVSITDIEDSFLHEIDFVYDQSPFESSNTSKLKKRYLEELGQKLKREQTSFNSMPDFVVGCTNAVVCDDQIRKILNSHKHKFRDKYIVAIPVDEDLSSLNWKGQDHHIRKGYYQHANAFFASNSNTIDFALGKYDTKENFLKEFKSYKPCFIGCDAHSCSEITEKLGQHYIKRNVLNPSKIDFEVKTTWIKANLSFEGLRQTIFEPAGRVRIQQLKPEDKPDRLIISSLKFISADELFGEQEIFLNENLNSIIGGKSSGKSLLLHSTAAAIDKNQVDRISKVLNIGEYKQSFDYDLVVKWRDGLENSLNIKPEEHEQRRITYIPQLYINYLAEKGNKEELNKLLLNILLQNSAFKGFYWEKIEEIKVATNQIESQLTEMLSSREKAINFNKELKEVGLEEAINKSLAELQKQIIEITKSSALNEQEQKAYTDLCGLDEKLNKEKQAIQNYIELTKKLNYEIATWINSLCGASDSNGVVTSNGKIDNLFAYYSDIPEVLNNIKSKLIVDLKNIKSDFIASIASLKYEEQLKIKDKEIESNNKLLEPFLAKLKGQKEITTLQEKVKQESLKLIKSKELKSKLNVAVAEFRTFKKNIEELLAKRYSLYLEIETKVNEEYSSIGEEITLSMSLVFPKEKLPLYEQVNKSKLKESNDEHEFGKLINYDLGVVNYTRLPLLFGKIKGTSANGEILTTNNPDEIYPLNQNNTIVDIYKGLIVDQFVMNFDVRYKNDTLLQMSPGKKGTVLLILFLQISSAEYPILIDQPEDNLDNRTIYELLCQMIKSKKINRQIIIVSHNANLVVATDSENIIVANQEGQTSSTGKNKHRFEYVNGALEHSFDDNNIVSGVLFQKGIKQHVCDILEGGDEAFKHRERKYSLKQIL